MFKISNCRTISQYFTCYCNNIMTMHAYSCATRIRNVTFVQQLTVYTSYMTRVCNGSNTYFCKPKTLNKRYFTLFIIKLYVIHVQA